MSVENETQEKTLESEEAKVETSETNFTSEELVSDLVSKLEEKKTMGHIIAVVDSSGRITPNISARSVGDLLTVKWVVEKEIDRLLNESTKK